MQLALLLLVALTAVVCQAETTNLAKQRLGAVLAHPKHPALMLERQTYEYCEAGTYECRNQDGCCPTGVTCVGDGTCDVSCSASDTICDASTCCPPGYRCPGTSGGPCLKTTGSGGGGGGGGGGYTLDYTRYSTSYYTINPGGDYTITRSYTRYHSYTDDDDDYDSYTDTYTDTYTSYTYSSDTSTTTDAFTDTATAFGGGTTPTSTRFAAPTGAAGRNARVNLGGALPLAGVVMALV